jgi:SPP1 gp7 family putative phage head morphogenesis protein
LTLPTLPDGDITPDWYKAMVLQLDPNDDEAEQLARMAIERRTERQLRQSLEEWLQSVLPSITEDEVQNIAYLLRNNQMRFRDVLQRALVDSADLGVSVAVNQLEGVGFGFDYTLANVEAREWARQHADDLLRGINETNDRVIGEAVARWIDNGEPLESLVNDIAGRLGGDARAAQIRARRIATTEVTRAYAEANTIAYQQSGVVQTMEWRTANDERVCPICGPLGGLRLDDRGQVVNAAIGQQQGAVSSLSNPQFTHPNGQTFRMPPAHPNCRCWVVPVIEEAQ